MLADFVNTNKRTILAVIISISVFYDLKYVLYFLSVFYTIQLIAIGSTLISLDMKNLVQDRLPKTLHYCHKELIFDLVVSVVIAVFGWYYLAAIRVGYYYLMYHTLKEKV